MSANVTFVSGFSSATSPSTAVRRGIRWSRYTLVGLAMILGAVLANTLFYYVGSALVGYDPDFVVLASPGGAIIFTFVPAVVAVVLYAGLLRFTQHAARNFSVIAAIVFVVTLVPDVTYIPTVDGSSPAQTAVLMIMHAIAAAVIVRMLTGGAYSRAR